MDITEVAPATALRRWEDLPGPRGLPLLGNALQVRALRFHQQLEQWARDFGPLYKLRLNERRLLVVGDHEQVAAVLRDRPEGFRRTSKMERIWVEMGLPIGVFGAHGETWARQRRMVMAGFDPAHVRRYYPAMQRVAANLGARWQAAARAGRAIDLQADLMRYTVDTIAGLAFGEQVNTLQSDEDVIQRHLDKIFPALFRRILSPIPLWRWHRSAADRELEAAIVEVKAAVAGFIAQARARMQAQPQRREHPENLLEAMIAAADAEGSGIDDEGVAGNVLTMLLAGEDTTANTLAWMTALLWRHPETLARAAAEVRGLIVEGAPITQEQLGRLDYLEACAHETMRLKPVAPVLPLQSLHEITVGDVRIPADTVVICLLRRDSVSDAHMGAHAGRFEPQRWLLGEESVAARAHAAKRIAMPFGAGPRICPGRYLALLEIKLAMATLLSRFEIAAVDTPDGAEPQERLAFTMAPLGLTMRLRER
ncbi:cytochrome P450 [Roseateles violae]|uniref:Cytochrome P450 n=1 Tax=Roseateles violae TaxID=3058042 RepID=A0ABT8DN27_9BURK|nr:cytochrome P450 [Pelomonas sp. PFR6]MDN3919358.1 cytochrome P450 [Pelomonas sp. PFR6]